MILCVILNKVSARLGIPALLAFILLGVLFGSDGLFKISFENYLLTEKISSVALVFIMFYGGFGTNWRQAKTVAVQATVLSTFGTVITAGLVGSFCYFVLKIAMLESFLIGAVICSTDAASVFSILRSKQLNLRYGTASLLEIESGSNDPFSYMLTVIVLSLMQGNGSAGGFARMLTAQIILGVAFGFGVAMLALLVFQNIHCSLSGYSAILMVAVALASYAAPAALGGNGFLSAYITGIVLGNSSGIQKTEKVELVHFFDGLTGLMQMVLFFMLGLLAFPSQLPGVGMTALAIALFLTFVARPAAVFALLAPFKSPRKQKLLVSWAGMRGAASIVFAILAVTSPVAMGNDIFHMVFFIVLFSVLLQGTLLPLVAGKLEMTDDGCNVMKTFNDYIDEIPIRFIQFRLHGNHPWTGKKVNEIVLPPDSLIVLLIRGDEKIIPEGETLLCEGDVLIMSGEATSDVDSIRIYERKVCKDDTWSGKQLADVPLEAKFVMVIRRAGSIIIPKGSTVIREDDILIVADKNLLDNAKP